MTGLGNRIAESRAVTAFSQIALRGIGTAIVTQGDGESLTVEAEEAVLPRIRTVVRDGRLTIDYEEGLFARLGPTELVRYYITVRDLDAVRLSGAANVEIARLTAGQFGITVSGSGNAGIGQLTAEHLAVSISGSGKIAVAGSVATQELRISGSGDYLAGRLASNGASLTVSGSGRATVQVRDALDVQISGSGSVEYNGDSSVGQAISGSGRVRKVANQPAGD